MGPKILTANMPRHAPGLAGCPRSVRAVMQPILEHVERETGATVAEMTGRCREYRVSHPRQRAMFLAHHQGGLSKVQIARFFGVDHSTVYQGIRAYFERACADIAGREQVK